jgi:hypothetical protein
LGDVRTVAGFAASHKSVSEFFELNNFFKLQLLHSPLHRNITVRAALKLMTERSLQVSPREVTPNNPIYYFVHELG